MGIVILFALIYLAGLGYWQNEMRQARRSRRWSRLGHCCRERDRILMWAGVSVVVTAAIYFS